MLIERSMHPGYLSNAYLVADEEGGTAVYVDSGAPIEPLQAAAERWGVTPVAVLRTHGHHDHVEFEDTLGVPVVTGDFEAGGLSSSRCRAPATATTASRSSSAAGRASPATRCSRMRSAARPRSSRRSSTP